MKMIKKLIKRALILSFLIIGISCSDEKFNFHFYSKQSEALGKTISVKGNLSTNGIPNGYFEIYEPQSKLLIADGNYSNGQKIGSWEYKVEGIDSTLIMNKVEFDDFTFSIPEEWKNVKNTQEATVYLSLSSDSIIKSNFSMRVHKKSQKKYRNFKDFKNALTMSVENELFSQKIDYSIQFQENFDITDISFNQYLAQDSDGRKLGAFYCLLDDRNGHFVEIALAGPIKYIAFHYRLFSEIILDIHVKGKPLINRWALDYII